MITKTIKITKLQMWVFGLTEFYLDVTTRLELYYIFILR